MKTVKPTEFPAFHGDISIRAVDKLPEGLERHDGNEHIVAHSETGHHHVALGGTYYTDPKNPMLAYLVVDQPTQLEHRRPYDTHETLELLTRGKGEVVYEIGRQREYTPGGWRQVID